MVYGQKIMGGTVKGTFVAHRCVWRELICFNVNENENDNESKYSRFKRRYILDGYILIIINVGICIIVWRNWDSPHWNIITKRSMIMSDDFYCSVYSKIIGWIKTIKNNNTK